MEGNDDEGAEKGWTGRCQEPDVTGTRALGLRPALLAGAVVALMAGGMVVPAQAARVQFTEVPGGDDFVSFRAAGGEANRLSVSRNSSQYIFRDSGAVLTAGEGCTQSAQEVRCSIGGPGGEPNMEMGDRDDRVSLAIHGGVVLGQAGADVLTAPQSLAGLTLGVSAEGFTSVLYGGLNNDTLNGGPGDDQLIGDANNDYLTGRGGPDLLEGGSGSDILRGGSGTDTHSAGSGNDTIYARDGRRETIRCGSGRDTVYADMRDPVVGCERVFRS